jgi:hypothetical protein
MAAILINEANAILFSVHPEIGKFGRNQGLRKIYP